MGRLGSPLCSTTTADQLDARSGTCGKCSDVVEEFRSSVVVVAAAAERVVVAEFFATTSLERAWLEVRNSPGGSHSPAREVIPQNPVGMCQRNES